MLIAEELVLLALEPDGTNARGATNQPLVAVAVTGALVSELVLDDHVRLDDDGRIRLSGTWPDHPLLRQVLENVAPLEGKRLKHRLDSIRHSGWSEVVDGMVDAGILGREREGLHPTRHPPVDPAAHAEVVERVRAAAAGDGPLDERTAVLLALSGPSHLLEVVAPDRATRKHARQRIDGAAELVPATAAVKAALQAVQVATTVAATTAATTG